MANTFKNVGVVVTATGAIASGNKTNIYTATTQTVFHALYLANVDTINDVSVSLAISKDGGTTWFHLAKEALISKKTTLILDKPINLEASDILAATATATNDVQVVGALLEIS